MTDAERQQERRERQALHLPPMKLHTRAVDEGGLGGHVWSKPFEAYIGSVIPNQTRAEREQWERWWTIPYVVDVLQDALGAQAVEALAMWLSDTDSYHAVTRRYRMRSGTLQSLYIHAKRLVRGLRPEMPRSFVA